MPNRPHALLGTALGLASLGFVVANSPAAAQSACFDGSVKVEFLGVGTSNTIIMEQIDGNYEGQVRVRVYCGADGQLIPNATVDMSTDVPNSTVNGLPATDPAAVSLSIPSGEQLVTLRSTDPDLSGWKAKVGTNTVTVTGAYGQSLNPSDYPTASGAIWAQTPELGSLALFGSGAAGMAGYVLTRLRARRK
jgi:hypothetical protein